MSQVQNFLITNQEIVDIMISQTYIDHPIENLILEAQILESIFIFGEQIKNQTNQENIFIQRVLQNENLTYQLEQILLHKDRSVYKIYRQLLEKFFDCDIIDNQLQMIKDTQYFHYHKIEMIDKAVFSLNNKKTYMDTLGLTFKDRKSYQNFSDYYFKYIRNNATKIIKNKNIFIDSQKELFNFNACYAVKDMVEGHFQIPQNLKRLTDNSFLYMGENSLNAINISSGVHKKLIDIMYPESLNTSSKFLMASGVQSQYKIFIYDLKQRKFLLNEQIHSEEIGNYTKFIDESQEFLITWNSPEIGIMDLNTLQIKQILQTRQGVNHLDVNFKSQLVVTAQDDNIVQLCDMRASDETVDFIGHERNNFAAIFLNENYIASGGEDCTTRIWDIRNSKKCLKLLNGENYQIGDLIYDKKNNFLHVLETKKYFYCFDLNGQVPQRQIQNVNAKFQGFTINEKSDKLYLAALHSPLKQYIQEFNVKVNQDCFEFFIQ